MLPAALNHNFAVFTVYIELSFTKKVNDIFVIKMTFPFVSLNKMKKGKMKSRTVHKDVQAWLAGVVRKNFVSFSF